MNNKKGQPEILATQTNSNVSPYKVQNSISSIKTQPNLKEKRKKDLEEARDEWTRKNNALTQKKIGLGYGDLSFEEFLNITLESLNKSQAELDPILALQNEIKEQKELWKYLWPEDAIVDELNKEHAVIRVKQFYVLTETEDPESNGKDFCLESKQSFKDYYENQTITCSDGVNRTKAEVWLKHPNRRKFKGVIFDTNGGPIVREHYNLWSGFAKQSKKGDCHLWWNFVKDVISDGNDKVYTYVRKWIASVFQKPDVLHTALCLCGEEGGGKNTFAETLGSLLGKHYFQFNGLSELFSNFNDHHKYIVLGYANEVMWHGYKKEVGLLKAYITDSFISIESKGKDRFRVKNHKHLIFASNDPFPLSLGHADRRVCVLPVSSNHINDYEYFKAILDERKNGGAEALLYDLLNEELSEFNPRILPNTSSSFGMKMKSTDSCGRYWYEALKERCCDIGNVTPNGSWGDIRKASLFNDYLSYCTRNNDRSVDIGTLISRIQEMCPTMEEKQPRSEDGTRPRTCFMPPLENARSKFEEYFKVNKEECHWND